jgi:hypothetical protein
MSDNRNILYDSLVKRHNLKIAPNLEEFKKRFPYSDLILDSDIFLYSVSSILLSEISTFVTNLLMYVNEELPSYPADVRNRINKKFPKEKMEKIYFKCMIEQYKLFESEDKARREANPDHLVDAINNSYEFVVKELFPLSEKIFSETRVALEKEINLK